MRRSLLTSLPLGAWLVACSTPGDAPSTESTAPPQAAPVVVAPPSGSELTSALEAGYGSGLELVRQAEAKGTGKRAERPKPQVQPALAALDQAVPEISAPVSTAPTLAAAPASMPTASMPARAVDTATNIGRGPMILIRGGVAGVIDNCAKHGPGHRGPIAINNRIPLNTGGGAGTVLVNERAPRFGGHSRMPRGGGGMGRIR